MTISRSLRPVAVTALAAGLVLPAAASAAGRSTGTGHGNVSHASSYSSHQRHKVDGVLQTMSGTTTPATLTAQMASGTTITVTVSARTTLLRGHGGRSGLAELTVGDRITAEGSFATGSSSTLAARRLTDAEAARGPRAHPGHPCPAGAGRHRHANSVIVVASAAQGCGCAVRARPWGASRGLGRPGLTDCSLK
jgi:hypothetical protein